MSVLGREQFEFKAIGLKELINQAKELETQTKATREANRKLNRSLADGSYVRAAKDYDKAARALKEVRREQELIAKQIKRDDLMRRYGRGGGLAAYYGGNIATRLGGAGRALGGAGSSLLGGAAALGATVSVGALASRGFSGTAAAAKLDQSFERLSRSVATDLLPAMDALSNIIGKISNAREKVRAGKGTAGDYATTAGFYGVLAGGLGLGAAGLTAFGTAQSALLKYAHPETHANMISRAGRFAGGASRFAGGFGGAVGSGVASMGRFAGPVGMIAGGAIQSHLDYTEAISSQNRRGLSQLTREDFEKHGKFIEQVMSMDPEARKKFLSDRRRQLLDKDRTLAERAQKRDMFSTIAASWFGVGKGAMDADEQKNINSGLTLIERIQKGETFGNGMKLVQGAGERRSSGDQFEELASSMGKLMGTQVASNDGNGPIGILSDIRDMLSQFFSKLNM